MTRRPEPGQIDVYRWADVEGGYLAVSAATGDRFAEMFPEPSGWWRVATARGVRGMWVQPNVPEPWRDIVHRLLRE